MKHKIVLRKASGLYYLAVPTKYIRDGIYGVKKIYSVEIKEWKE